jgi:chromosome segregation protein
MADVIFNGSSERKPIGTASVELLFDNSDGKIGGAYAGFNEVSLKRTVSRDGTSVYFINGARCRRKDITHLFLGTGLGSRSYAIIEQGMISRVIEAKADDMRAFLEEAAGISRYKERRKETEARIADTRENLERLQDVRDEVDKQIRHLQRQAGVARRYQGFKDQERRLTAEVLALKLRDLESGAGVHDSALRRCELAMQAALADQRAAEAAIEKQRGFHAEQNDQLAAVQGRYYEIGAQITRTEQNIQHTRELRERQRSDLTKAETTLSELAAQIERDQRDLAALRADLRLLEPQLEQAQLAEQGATRSLEAAESAVAEWQQRWEVYNRDLGAAQQTTQVERARIEQLDNQLRRLTSHGERLAGERAALAVPQGATPFDDLARRESHVRLRSEELERLHLGAHESIQQLRARQVELEQSIEAARQERDRLRSEQLSLEAVQKAALGRASDGVSEWLSRAGLGSRERLAEILKVEPGWERAVETVLGDSLEAVCVDALDEIAGELDRLPDGRFAVMELGSPGETGAARRLGSMVQGPAAVLRLLSRVQTTESLADALRRRRSLGEEESIATRTGEWVGRDWLRVSRGTDHHAGVIAREQRLHGVRRETASAMSRLTELEAELASLRAALARGERERDDAQGHMQSAHREHADLLAQLEAMRARSEESTLRRARLAEEAADVARETATSEAARASARQELERGQRALADLAGRAASLETERDQRRAAGAAARSRAHAAQLAARDLLVKVESRRSAESSMRVTLERVLAQRTELQGRIGELGKELASGDSPVTDLEMRLQDFLTRRLEVEGSLAVARRVLEGAEMELRRHEEQRLAAEQRVAAARDEMEAARLAAQETRVRRESLAEQFAATRFDLAEVRQGLAADADVLKWEESLASVRADLDSLGQVNLAAIDELKESSERKDYLDRQFKDLTDALATLDQAMRRIDKETRARFAETFDRVNAGLKEKFPRLFGGGHAYLELVGDDVLSAGVAVMARPPGKRNSTIAQLSGGEKALTAVALVFAIFDLNPAPFCLLDEVDAPLDEHNVGRFCDIVRDMSSRVQFIFITHNKATMELASHLIGVTMNEPGVSRLVAVDVDEAVRMAAV